MLKLQNLDPEFLFTIDGKTLHKVETVNEANGIRFLCPKCFSENSNSPIGVHSIIAWNNSVQKEISPKPGRWAFSGSNFSDLTLKPSINCEWGCGAHFHITNGEIDI